MEIYEYISILSTTLWMLVPFFLKKSKHFFFFFFAGLNDSIGLTFWYAFHMSSQITWIPFFYLMVLSIDKTFFVRNLKIIMAGLVILLIVNYYSTTYYQYAFVLIGSVIITTIFGRYFYWEYIKNNKVSLFYLVMTFYGLLSVYKTILAVGNINLGLSSFFVTTIIQIGIGLFLILVKKDHQFTLKD